jgi:hypothetical protein
MPCGLAGTEVYPAKQHLCRLRSGQRVDTTRFPVCDSTRRSSRILELWVDGAMATCTIVHASEVFEEAATRLGFAATLGFGDSWPTSTRLEGAEPQA